MIRVVGELLIFILRAQNYSIFPERSLSTMIWKLHTVKNKMLDGSNNRYGKLDRVFQPSRMRMPQLVSGGWMPNPIKLMKLSYKMLVGTCKATSTINELRTCGRTCLRMMCFLLPPKAMAASMKDFLFISITSPRVTRASDIQCVIEIPKHKLTSATVCGSFDGTNA